MMYICSVYLAHIVTAMKKQTKKDTIDPNSAEQALPYQCKYQVIIL